MWRSVSAAADQTADGYAVSGLRIHDDPGTLFGENIHRVVAFF